MKLKRITLENFRPFYGKHALEFAEQHDRNVTLVHAQNGMGKTTLLNALLWAFHGEVTEGFRDPQLLVNKEAKARGVDVARVEVQFEFEKKQYELTRSGYDAQENSTVRVHIVANDGTLKPHPFEKQFIQQVFPREMAAYFFFDGEYAQNFAMSTGKSGVKSAIRKILGCTPAEWAIEDLAEAEKRLHGQVRKTTTNSQINDLEERREKKELEISSIDQALPILEEEKLQIKRELNEIHQRLVEIEASAEIERQLQRDLSELDKAERQESEIAGQRFRWISDAGPTLASKRIAEKCAQITKELEKRAEIPAPYNETFVKSLLSQQKCICGRPLELGSEEIASVTELLSTAAESESLRRLVHVQAFGRNISQRKKEKLDRFFEIERNLVATKERARRLEISIKEAREKLKGIDTSDVSARVAARDKKGHRQREVDRQEVDFKNKRRAAENELKSIDEQIAQCSREDKKLTRLSRQLELVKAAKSKLERLLEKLESDALSTLKSDVNSLIRQIMRKAYSVDISSDFRLTLLDEAGRPAPPSGGEGQLLSLVFIASLIRFCAKRQSDRGVILSPGTVAPMVLDSPFGQLDPEYRKGAASFLSEFADQVVLLLSASQGDDGVLKALGPTIGSEVVLVQHNESDRPPEKEDEVDEIVIDGTSINVTVWESGPTRTEIQNIRYY